MDTFYSPNAVKKHEDEYHFFSDDEAAMIKYSSQWFSPEGYENEAERKPFLYNFTGKECLSPNPDVVMDVRPIDNIEKVPPKSKVLSTLKTINMKQWKKITSIQKDLKIVKSKKLVISPVPKVNSAEKKRNVNTMKGSAVKGKPKKAQVVKKENLGGVEKRKVQDTEQAPTPKVIVLYDAKDSTPVNVTSFHNIIIGKVVSKKMMLRCKICHRIFDNINNFKYHFASHKNLLCGRCFILYETAQEFLSHEKKCMGK